MRKRANGIRQKKQFARTATKTKKINLNPSVKRGGIRL